MPIASPPPKKPCDSQQHDKNDQGDDDIDGPLTIDSMQTAD
jgi:hypothetical protein